MDIAKNRPLEVLSLGAGVQSSAVFMMSCLGELPRLDAAILADTQWEPAAVYKHLEWLKGQAEKYGIPLLIRSGGNIRSDTLDTRDRNRKGRLMRMPLRTLGGNGSAGMITRQCTSEYKIAVVERAIRRDLLGLRHRERMPRDVTIRHWFGISADELRRVRQSRARWQINTYPLIFEPENQTGWDRSKWRRRRRHHCLEWLADRGMPRPPRSACIGCPYRSNAEWRALTPEEFEDACTVDDAIRDSDGMRGQLFLHRDLVPLREVDLRTKEEHGQLNWLDECQGMCGV